MRGYSEAAWERAMKMQEVILRPMAKWNTWCRCSTSLPNPASHFLQ